MSADRSTLEGKDRAELLVISEDSRLSFHITRRFEIVAKLLQRRDTGQCIRAQIPARQEPEDRTERPDHANCVLNPVKRFQVVDLQELLAIPGHKIRPLRVALATTPDRITQGTTEGLCIPA